MRNPKILKRLAGLSLVLLLGIGILFSSSCRKDRSMTLTITAKLMGDTNQVVPDAKVLITKDDILVEGYTDSKGEFRHTFNLQIQLDVVVSKDTIKGIGMVNLGELGEDVEKSIYLF
jgi:hypothetical protein